MSDSTSLAKVMIDAHGIDIRIEGPEPTAELAKLAVAAFDHALEAKPSHRTIGFASGSNVQTERAYDDRPDVTLSPQRRGWNVR